MHPVLQLQTYLKDENIHIQLDNRAGYIYVEWLRHPSSEDFRRLYKQAADLAMEKECRYWLSDACALHFIDFSDQNWLLRELAPRLQTTNLKKYARVSTQESMTMLDVQRICYLIEGAPQLKDIQTQIQMFLDKESALDWLFSDIEE